MSPSASPRRDSKSGTWWFIVDLAPDAGGRRRQAKRRGFGTRKAAQEALDQLRVSSRNGSYVAPARRTLAAYLEDWLDGLMTAGRRENTIDSYRRTLRLHVVPHLGGRQLQALTPVDFDKLYTQLLVNGRRDGRGGLSARSVRYVHTIVSKALNDAERKGIVPRNVARLADPPSAGAAKAPEMRAWSPAELTTFLNQAADHRHGALLRVAAMTGLRRGELCGLRWSDVDLDAQTLRVCQSVTTVNHEPLLGPVKTARSRRTVDLDAKTVAVLRRHRSAQLEQRLTMGAGWVECGRVFVMPDGQPWHPDHISQAFEALVSTSGLPRIRFHDLRHSHASHLVAAGANIKIVSERLGHASTSFTLDTYAHVMPGQQATAAAAAAALVDG